MINLFLQYYINLILSLLHYYTVLSVWQIFVKQMQLLESFLINITHFRRKTRACDRSGEKVDRRSCSSSIRTKNIYLLRHLANLFQHD